MRKSMTAAILVVFAGYAVASYGYVLLRGWDISWKQWIDPLDAYVWAGTPGFIPAGQVFPNQATLAVAAVTAGAPSTPAQSKNPGVAATGAPANSVGAVGGGFGR
jgi:hypothetical protein